ncbi:hypothetical protein SLA2020_431040 [Shorea laevis]
MEENRRPQKSKQIVAETCDKVDDGYFESFPPGYRFRPTKEELIYYLKAKVSNETLPRNRIPEINLYHYHPQELTRMYKLVRETEWYFFTPRERKYPNGSRPNRAAAHGYWKPTGKDKSITVGTTRGSRKSLDYYEGKHPTGKKTNWKMHEYRLHEDIAPPKKKGENGMKLDEWVLCKVYRKAESKKDKNNGSVETVISDQLQVMNVHGNYSGTATSTTFNNSSDNPLQQQSLAYDSWATASTTSKINAPGCHSSYLEPLQHQSLADFSGASTSLASNNPPGPDYAYHEPPPDQFSAGFSGSTHEFTNEILSTHKDMVDMWHMYQNMEIINMSDMYSWESIATVEPNSSELPPPPLPLPPLEVPQNDTLGSKDEDIFDSLNFIFEPPSLGLDSDGKFQQNTISDQPPK